MRLFRKAAVCTAMALAGLPGAAQASDEIVRGVIGLGTAIILHEMNRNKQAAPPRAQRPAQGKPGQKARRQASAQELAARESRKEVQRSLNQLGFNAGPADGVFGRRTRNAISLFQSSIGHSPTGKITEEQIALLHQRATGGQSASGQHGFPALADGQFSQKSTGAAQHGFPPLGGGGEPGQPGGGFPPLGAPQTGDGGAATSPFPKLAAPGVAAGSGSVAAFPPLGAPPAAAADSQQLPPIGQVQEPAQEAGFPVIGSPAAPAATGHGFPPLAQPGAVAGQPAMPAIGQPQEQETTFPVIGSPSQPAPSEHGFPPLSQTEPVAGQPSMPTITAPETSVAVMPAIETPAVLPENTAAATLQTRTLESELARLEFGLANQPAILGISLGQSFEEALLAIEEAGFAECSSTETPKATHCERQTETLGDQLSIMATPDNEIWSVARTIGFASPVPMAALAERFGETYPQMMDQETNIRWLSSGPLCPGAMAEPHLAARVNAIQNFVDGQSQSIPDDVAHFADHCPLLYSLNFAETSGGVSSVTIRFVNATVIDEVRQKLDEAEAENLKAVTNDLKL